MALESEDNSVKFLAKLWIPILIALQTTPGFAFRRGAPQVRHPRVSASQSIPVPSQSVQGKSRSYIPSVRSHAPRVEISQGLVTPAPGGRSPQIFRQYSESPSDSLIVSTPLSRPKSLTPRLQKSRVKENRLPNWDRGALGHDLQIQEGSIGFGWGLGALAAYLSYQYGADDEDALAVLEDPDELDFSNLSLADLEDLLARDQGSLQVAKSLIRHWKAGEHYFDQQILTKIFNHPRCAQVISKFIFDQLSREAEDAVFSNFERELKKISSTLTAHHLIKRVSRKSDLITPRLLTIFTPEMIRKHLISLLISGVSGLSQHEETLLPYFNEELRVAYAQKLIQWGDRSSIASVFAHSPNDHAGLLLWNFILSKPTGYYRDFEKILSATTPEGQRSLVRLALTLNSNESDLLAILVSRPLTSTLRGQVLEKISRDFRNPDSRFWGFGYQIELYHRLVEVNQIDRNLDLEQLFWQPLFSELKRNPSLFKKIEIKTLNNFLRGSSGEQEEFYKVIAKTVEDLGLSGTLPKLKDFFTSFKGPLLVAYYQNQKNTGDVFLSPSESHLWNNYNNIPEDFSRQLRRNPEIINLFQKIIDDERRALQEGKTSFVHAIQTDIAFLGDLYTQAWSIQNNEPVDQYIFLRFNDLKAMNSDHVRKQNEAIRKRLIESKGRTDSDPGINERDYLIFMNLALFGNLSRIGSNSVYYFLYNHNVNPLKMSKEHVFERLGLTDFYQTHLNEFEELEKLFKSLHPSTGVMYQFKFTKEALEKYTYVAEMGGYPKEVYLRPTLDTCHQINEMFELVENFRDRPHHFSSQCSSAKYSPPPEEVIDRTEFCFIATDLGPGKGVEVKAYHAGDPEKWTEYHRKRDALFSKLRDMSSRE